MKPKDRPTIVGEPNLASPTAPPAAQWLDEKQICETNAVVMAGTPALKEHATAELGVPTDYLKALVSIATNAWRAKVKMVDATTGQVREEMKRVDRHIEAIYRSLAEVGIVIRDHTRDAYDEGQPMKVVASKPNPGLDRERVCETLLPSIFWNNRLVQNGEIVTETPPMPNTPTESQPQQS
jgi:hypothetical protein